MSMKVSKKMKMKCLFIILSSLDDLHEFQVVEAASLDWSLFPDLLDLSVAVRNYNDHLAPSRMPRSKLNGPAKVFICISN